MENFIWLIFAHVIGDIALQGDFLAMNKGKHWIVMAWHALIWTALICVVLEWLGIYAIWKAVFLFFGHFVCDSWKCKNGTSLTSWHLYADQLFHLGQCLFVFF